MSDLKTILAELEANPDAFDALSGQLVWRIGQRDDDGPLIVRVGLASSTTRFADLPRLRNVSDQDLEAALQAGNVRVEWVTG